MKSKQPTSQIPKKNGSIPSTPDADDTKLWESRELGASEEFVRKVSAKRGQAVDDALGLQPITIRLQKDLVDELKELARAHGIGYQPYVRQVLTRHVKEKQAMN